MYSSRTLTTSYSQERGQYNDPYLHRFTSPDSIVPNLYAPQSLNRYGYVVNNPIRYNDPTGHMCSDPEDLWSASCDGSGATKSGDHIIPGEHVGGSQTPLEDCLDPIGCAIQAVYIFVAESQPGSATEQAWELVDEWYNEEGEVDREFGPDNPLTQEIMYDYQMELFRTEWADSGYKLPFTFNPTIDNRGEDASMIEAIMVMLREHVWELGLATLGFGSEDLEGPIDAVGGTIGSLDRVTASDAGNGMVLIQVFNKMGFASLFRIPSKDRSFGRNIPRSAPGPGGTTSQRFYWYESLP